MSTPSVACALATLTAPARGQAVRGALAYLQSKHPELRPETSQLTKLLLDPVEDAYRAVRAAQTETERSRSVAHLRQLQEDEARVMRAQTVSRLGFDPAEALERMDRLQRRTRRP